MKEAIRRINYFSTAFVAVLGISMIGEVFMENDLEDKLDDALLFILGLLTIWWYKKKGNTANSAIPSVIIFGLSILIKVMAVVIEHADKEAVGDDIGILATLVVGFIFVCWQAYVLRKKEN